MAFLASLLLLPLTVLSLQAETGVRARVNTVPVEGGIDLLARPSASLSFSERNWQAGVTTSSALSYLNVGDPTRGGPTWSQTLDTVYTRTFRRVTVSLSESGQIGRSNLLASALGGGVTTTPGPPAGNSGLPPNGSSNTQNSLLLDKIIWYGAVSASLFVSEQISSRLTLGEFARTGITSSFAEDAAAYPAQISLGGGMSLGAGITARDTLTSQASVDRVRTDNLPAANILGFSESWSHAFTPRVTGSVAAGVTYVFPDNGDKTVKPQVLPTAGLGLSISGSPISVSVTVTPVINQRLGFVDPRVSGTVQYVKGTPQVSYFATATGSTSIVSTAPTSTVTLSTGLGFVLTRDLTLNTGVGGNYQIAYAVDISDTTASWVFFGFANLVYTAGRFRL